MDFEDNKKDNLRGKAEELFRNDSENDRHQYKDEEYVHELRVHQIELELQNEELREAQKKLEDSRNKFFDLYNFAPVGYFTLDKNLIIIEANLAGSKLLGVEKNTLKNTAFIQYITFDDRNIFHHHIKNVLETGTKQNLELKLRKKDNNFFYTHIETIAVDDNNGIFREFRLILTDITELKNTENALKESEKRYREIFIGNHAVMLQIDPFNGDIVDANPAATKFYGYNHDELLKMQIYDLNKTDNELLYEKMQKAKSEEENHFIFKHRLKNGTIRDVDVYSGVLNQKGKKILHSIIYDITAQKRAEIALFNSIALFRLIFDQSPLGSIIISLDYTPLQVNNALINMLGYSKKELLSMKFFEYTYFEDLEEELRQKVRLISGEIDNFVMEKRYIHKNGEIVWANLTVSAINDQSNKPVRYLTLIEDITNRKKMENQIKKHTDKLTNINKLLNVEIGDYEKAEIILEELIEKLEISNRELEQFAYVSSHDLKEPLRMIKSFLLLLKKGYANTLDDNANKYINFAVEGAKRLEIMINELLEYSRIGSQDVPYKNINCEEIIKTVLINLKTLIDDNQAIVTYDKLPNIYVNDRQMTQLFQNLIVNAIKYRGEEKPEIHISVDKFDNEYIFSIRDNGIGIDKKHLNRIFTIFQRLHTQEEYDGTGIGLAISQKIVEQHHGKIWAESKPGHGGTTFHFTIPIKNNK